MQTLQQKIDALKEYGVNFKGISRTEVDKAIQELREAILSIDGPSDLVDRCEILALIGEVKK